MVRNSLILLMLLLIPGASGAANLYLKDGGIIECIRAKRQNGTVYVLVNRFTEVELDRSDVDISKTFKGKQSIGSYRQPGKSRMRR